jgi:hypothetical protein
MSLMPARFRHGGQNFRQRRAADTARWRDRLRRGAAVYPIEIDDQIFQMMERFAGLKRTKWTTGKLLRLALAALLRQATSQR